MALYFSLFTFNQQGLLSVGFFCDEDELGGLNNGSVGLFHGGGPRSLGVQAAAAASIMGWAGLITFIITGALRLTLGLRMTREEEMRGADASEHLIDSYGANSLVVVKGMEGKLEVRRRSMFGKI